MQNFQPLAIFACTTWFVLDLFKNHIVGFLRARLIFAFTDILDISFPFTRKSFLSSVADIVHRGTSSLNPQSTEAENLEDSFRRVGVNVMHQSFVTTAPPPMGNDGG